MNSNLIPERRTDKNGRTTTRWVKPGTTSGKSKTELPAPKTAPVFQTPELDKLFQRANLNQRGMKTAELDPRTTRAVEEFLTTASTHPSVTMSSDAQDTVFGSLIAIRDGYGEKHDYADINNVAVFGQTFLEGGYTKDRMFMYRQGIHMNGAFPFIQDFLLEANDEEREQAKALVKFANEAPEPFSQHYFGYDETNPDDSPEDHADYDDGDYYVRVAGDDAVHLTQFIMKHHDQVSDIIRIVKERKDADLTMLENMLGHEQQSLRSGLL